MALKLTLELEERDAWLLAQFAKRVTWRDCRDRMENDHQAYATIDIFNRIREEMREQLGIYPR